MPRFGPNTVVKGKKGSYQVIKYLSQNVFQANIRGTSTSVAIKIEDHAEQVFLNEASVYGLNCITRSHIRSLREYVNTRHSYCLIFEWMDNTLWETKEASIETKSRVFKLVAKSCLEALVVVQDMDKGSQCLHADLNPNNILVSAFSGPTPVVKLADFGLSMRAGFRSKEVARIQGDAIRAPEIWKGASPSPACDIWSLGVSLAHWMSSRIMFGIGGCNIRTNHPKEVTEAAWCIAKLYKMRGAELVGPIEDDYVMEWAITENILSQDLIHTLNVGEELEKKQVPLEYIEFIEHLLTVDPENRPSAVEALEHPLLIGV